MSPAGFVPAIPASELLRTHVLDRTATAIGTLKLTNVNKKLCLINSVIRPHESGDITE